MILSVEPESTLTLRVLLISFHPLTPTLFLLSIAFQSPSLSLKSHGPTLFLRYKSQLHPCWNQTQAQSLSHIKYFPWIKFFLPPLVSVINFFLTFPSSVSKDYSQRNIVLHLYSLYYIPLQEQISKIKTFHVSTIQTENIF